MQRKHEKARPAFIFIGVALAFGIWGMWSLISQRAVVTVNEIAVRETEFRLLMDRHRAMVIQEYGGKHGLPYDGAFWNTRVDGQSPAERLKQLALRDTVRLKTIESLAVELGLVDEAGFQTLLSAMKEENRKRADSAQVGKVVYGSLQYSEKGFYDYYHSNLEISLKNTLTNGTLAPMEGDVVAYYDGHTEEFQNYYLKFELLSIPHQGERDGPAKTAAEAANCAAASGLPLAEAADLCGEEAEVKVEEITDENLRSYAKYEGDVFALLDELEPGALAGPFDWNGQFCIARCLEKGGAGRKPIDEVRGEIENILGTERFEQYLEQQIALAVVDVHKSVLSGLEIN